MELQFKEAVPCRAFVDQGDPDAYVLYATEGEGRTECTVWLPVHWSLVEATTGCAWFEDLREHPKLVYRLYDRNGDWEGKLDEWCEKNDGVSLALVPEPVWYEDVGE